MLRSCISEVKGVFKHLIDMIYPPFCLLCDEVMSHGSEKILCDPCLEKWPVLSGELCTCCSKPLLTEQSDRCSDCRKKGHFYEQGKALWVYEEALQKRIKQYKYGNRRELGIVFANALGRYYNEYMNWPIDMVIPVPPHKKRVRERGHNQMLLIGKNFSRLTDLPLCQGGLMRVLPTKAQEGLSDKERLLNVSKAFIADGDMVRGKNILLLDDVYTTGATMDSCSKVLLEAGANRIYFMTVAIGRGC